MPTRWKVGNDIVQLVINDEYAAALSRNGTLGVWGQNISDGCGTGSDEDCLPEGFDEDVVHVHG